MGSTTWYAAVGAVVMGGVYFVDTWTSPVAVSAPVVETPARIATIALPAPEPVLRVDVDDPDDAIDDALLDVAEPEPIRGHAPIEDPAEFAMVFTVDGATYLRLSTEERASVRGRARLIEGDGVVAVVAPVTASALPGKLRAWDGRTVLVDGTCRARVVGFAEVSRSSGEPGDGSWDPETGEYTPPPPWTIDRVVEDGVTLAARLDGCRGTWARAESYSPAAVAAKISEPALESAAIADLLAADRPDLDQLWKDAGMDQTWRDSAELATQTYQHPLTGERWVFAQAHRAGGCGDPGFDLMAAYRVDAGGKLHRVADLDHGYQTIREVIDLDGDGQPELLFGSGNTSELVDLASTNLDVISVPYHHYGCGC